MRVNAVVWVMSPKDEAERISTEQVLTFLEPFLTAKNIPFLKHEPKTAADLYEFLENVEERAKAGLTLRQGIRVIQEHSPQT
jgi:hypothetical protein